MVFAAVSQTDQRDICGADTVGTSTGAPSIPTVGPLGHFAISADETNVGASGSPAISCADTRFSAGYNRLPTTT